MNRIIVFMFFAVFCIFIGSQIAEGVILVPYWKSMSADAFYTFYSEFGGRIGMFYTILTISAALVSIIISIYCFRTKSVAFKYALITSLTMMLVIAIFYYYFIGANSLFYEALLSLSQLKNELKIWEIWHWARVGIEFIGLYFFILTCKLLTQK